MSDREVESAPPRQRAFRRVALALTLLVLPAFAGCLEGNAPPAIGDTLPVAKPPGGDFAVPARVLVNPSEENSTPRSPEPDPRLNVTARWYPGDWWYYESNHSHFMRRVVERVVVFDGTPYYKVRDERGLIGYPPKETTTSIMTIDFRTVNRTRSDGMNYFDPPNPEERFLPGDNTFVTNESGYATLGSGVVKWNIKWNVRVTEAFPLYPHRVPAGTFNASHFRVASEKVVEGRDPAYVFEERWFSPDVRADVQFVHGARSKDPERFQLVAFVFKGERGGLTPEYLPY